MKKKKLLDPDGLKKFDENIKKEISSDVSGKIASVKTVSNLFSNLTFAKDLKGFNGYRIDGKGPIIPFDPKEDSDAIIILKNIKSTSGRLPRIDLRDFGIPEDVKNSDFHIEYSDYIIDGDSKIPNSISVEVTSSGVKRPSDDKLNNVHVTLDSRMFSTPYLDLSVNGHQSDKYGTYDILTYFDLIYYPPKKPKNIIYDTNVYNVKTNEEKVLTSIDSNKITKIKVDKDWDDNLGILSISGVSDIDDDGYYNVEDNHIVISKLPGNSDVTLFDGILHIDYIIE